VTEVESQVVVRATGFQREEWFKLLDARNAQALSEPEIAAWLRTNTKLDDWWSTAIAGWYVAARGLASGLQAKTGLFATAVSRDFQVELPRLFLVLVDLSAWPNEPRPRMLLRKENERFQVVFDDASRAMLTFIEHQPGYITVVVTHELIENESDIDGVEKYWTRLLDKTAERLGA